MLLTIHNTETSESSLLRSLTEKINTRFPGQSLRWCTEKYRQDPSLFAHRILGSKWWSRQEDIARALVQHRRVAVKSANGVGKTYLAADLALWFLYTHRPSIVITTAPTKKQVETVLWEEIKSRWQNAKVRLPGNLFTTKLKAGPRWYAIGISTNHPDRFQGFHHKDMLIIFDEASGIADPIWIASEGVAVGDNNKILAIGNPLRTEGRFYRIFRDRSGWHKESITALEHPNLTGKGPPIPGCTTLATVEALIADWCEPLTPPESGPGGPTPPELGAGAHSHAESNCPEDIAERAAVHFICTNPSPGRAPVISQGWPIPWVEEPDVGKSPPGTHPPNPTESPPATESPPESEGGNKATESPPELGAEFSGAPLVRAPERGHARGQPADSSYQPVGRDPTLNSQPSTLNSDSPAPDIFVFKGRRYKPNNLFRARILALFPDAGDESLIPIRWIEAATSDKRTLPADGYVRAAVDVARFGDDDTVIGIRTGPVVEPFSVVHGHDTMAVAQQVKLLAYERHPHSIAVDSIGIGAGVVDRLMQMGIEGVIPINVAKAAFDQENFANRRAELYWGLRERFREGVIVIPNDEKLIEELASIRYFIASLGKIQIESKDQMKRRLGGSPDRADALALLMDSSSDWIGSSEPVYVPESPAAKLRREMEVW